MIWFAFPLTTVLALQSVDAPPMPPVNPGRHAAVAVPERRADAASPPAGSQGRVWATTPGNTAGQVVPDAAPRAAR